MDKNIIQIYFTGHKLINRLFWLYMIIKGGIKIMKLTKIVSAISVFALLGSMAVTASAATTGIFTRNEVELLYFNAKRGDGAIINYGAELGLNGVDGPAVSANLMDGDPSTTCRVGNPGDNARAIVIDLGAEHKAADKVVFKNYSAAMVAGFTNTAPAENQSIELGALKRLNDNAPLGNKDGTVINYTTGTEGEYSTYTFEGVDIGNYRYIVLQSNGSVVDLGEVEISYTEPGVTDFACITNNGIRTYYSALTDATNSAGNGQVVTLLQDSNNTGGRITIGGKGITIEADADNPKTITTRTNQTPGGLLINTNHTLTLNYVNLTTGGGVTLAVENGTVNYNNGTITGDVSLCKGNTIGRFTNAVINNNVIFKGNKVKLYLTNTPVSGAITKRSADTITMDADSSIGTLTIDDGFSAGDVVITAAEGAVLDPLQIGTLTNENYKLEAVDGGLAIVSAAPEATAEVSGVAVYEGVGTHSEEYALGFITTVTNGSNISGVTWNVGGKSFAHEIVNVDLSDGGELYFGIIINGYPDKNVPDVAATVN